MRTTKSILTGILAVILGFWATVCASAQTEDDFTVTFTADGEGVIITGYTGPARDILQIPTKIQEMPVREIGKESLIGGKQADFTSVVIPSGVTQIGEKAFMNNRKLKTVTIPEGVQIIGNSAFSGTGLTTVSIPSTVTNIGGSAFNGSNLGSITLSSGLTSLNGRIFYNCKSLTSIIIPEGVTTIEGEAFSGCVAMVSVTLPSTIKKIGEKAFLVCSNLITVNIPDTVEAIIFGEPWANDAFQRCSKLNLASQAALKKRGYTGPF
ncbi:hypothetical protein FACS189476_02930 [Spirochaetia bacterium]|nr:hypothetical protein FACS189476_02930 [Spirochaetia bacterium]